MPLYRLNIIFSGVDLNDDTTFDVLADLPEVMWRSQADLAFATAVVDAPSALKAADEVTRNVVSVVPSARPLRLDEDLVSIPDIAERLAFTREAVRNWANGTRKAHFPLPRGIVGDAIKVWAWSDVNEWARQNLSLGDVERYPSGLDIALINVLFEEARDRQAIFAAAIASWTAASSLVRDTLPLARPAQHVTLSRRPARLSVFPSEGSVAA